MIRKILYIGYQYEFGQKENGEAINNKAFPQSFRKMGMEVISLWYEAYSKDELRKIIFDTSVNWKPDLVYFVLQREQIDVSTLLRLKQNGLFIVNWFGDDQWRFDDFSSKYANYFDACITTDKFSVGKYIKIGQKNVVRSQWASNDPEARSEEEEYKYEISFIGGINPYRKWFIGELKSRGIDVVCFGDGWPNGRVSWEDMERIFRVSKINLNISNSVQYDIRYLIRNPRNLINTLRNPKNRSQTKARLFEIPVYGGFELTEYVPSLEDYFDIGKEMVCYRDIDEAELMLAYYLENENERESIKIESIKKAREEHTFVKRLEKILIELEKFREQKIGA